MKNQMKGQTENQMGNQMKGQKENQMGNQMKGQTGGQMKSSKYTLDNFQTQIGYRFNNLNLLRQALTHSSYANEHRMNKLYNNERLEFLGDAVLEVVSSEFLYKKYPDMQEGQLSKKRASLVCEPTLARCAAEIELGQYLYLGKGEEITGGRERDSVVSDAMEAVIGAVFLDSGLENAKAFILKYILNDIEHKVLFHDSKTLLQEIVQAKWKVPVTFETVDAIGPEHHRIFVVQAKKEDEVLGTGEGRTKQAAGQDAAYKAILKIKETYGETCI